MQEGWDKPLWLLKRLFKKSDENMAVLTNKLESIQNIFKTAGSATATGQDILYGKTAYNGSTLLTGSMPNQGAKSKTLNCGSSFTIPKGYHNGSGVVKANSLASQTAVDADKAAVTSSTMLEGRQAWVNGNKVSGSMANKSGTTVETSVASISGGEVYLGIPSTGYYNTDSMVKVDGTLLKDGIKIYPLAVKTATKAANGNGIYGASTSYTLTADYDYIVASGAGFNAYSDARNDFQSHAVKQPTYEGTGTIATNSDGKLVVKNAKKGGVITCKNTYNYTLNGEVHTGVTLTVYGIRFCS